MNRRNAFNGRMPKSGDGDPCDNSERLLDDGEKLSSRRGRVPEFDHAVQWRVVWMEPGSTPIIEKHTGRVPMAHKVMLCDSRREARQLVEDYS